MKFSSQHSTFRVHRPTKDKTTQLRKFCESIYCPNFVRILTLIKRYHLSAEELFNFHWTLTSTKWRNCLRIRSSSSRAQRKSVCTTVSQSWEKLHLCPNRRSSGQLHHRQSHVHNLSLLDPATTSLTVSPLTERLRRSMSTIDTCRSVAAGRLPRESLMEFTFRLVVTWPSSPHSASSTGRFRLAAVRCEKRRFPILAAVPCAKSRRFWIFS